MTVASLVDIVAGDADAAVAHIDGLLREGDVAAAATVVSVVPRTGIPMLLAGLASSGFSAPAHAQVLRAVAMRRGKASYELCAALEAGIRTPKPELVLPVVALCPDAVRLCGPVLGNKDTVLKFVHATVASAPAFCVPEDGALPDALDAAPPQAGPWLRLLSDAILAQCPRSVYPWILALVQARSAGAAIDDVVDAAVAGVEHLAVEHARSRMPCPVLVELCAVHEAVGAALALALCDDPGRARTLLRLAQTIGYTAPLGADTRVQLVLAILSGAAWSRMHALAAMALCSVFEHREPGVFAPALAAAIASTGGEKVVHHTHLLLRWTCSDSGVLDTIKAALAHEATHLLRLARASSAPLDYVRLVAALPITVKQPTDHGGILDATLAILLDVPATDVELRAVLTGLVARYSARIAKYAVKTLLEHAVSADTEGILRPAGLRTEPVCSQMAVQPSPLSYRLSSSAPSNAHSDTKTHKPAAVSLLEANRARTLGGRPMVSLRRPSKRTKRTGSPADETKRLMRANREVCSVIAACMDADSNKGASVSTSIAYFLARQISRLTTPADPLPANNQYHEVAMREFDASLYRVFQQYPCLVEFLELVPVDFASAARCFNIVRSLFVSLIAHWRSVKPGMPIPPFVLRATTAVLGFLRRAEWVPEPLQNMDEVIVHIPAHEVVPILSAVYLFVCRQPPNGSKALYESQGTQLTFEQMRKRGVREGRRAFEAGAGAAQIHVVRSVVRRNVVALQGRIELRRVFLD